MTISDQKKTLRMKMRTLRAEISEKEKEIMDRLICERIVLTEKFACAKTVFIYCSTGAEIDTHGIISVCLESGKLVCVPRCEKDRGVMTARRLNALSELVLGKYGIPEPQENALIIPPDQIDLCIVPCLAADREGYRLGYGGGYYDRFLSKTRCSTIALCADNRIIDSVPHEAFDISCDYIFTERRNLIRETYET